MNKVTKEDEEKTTQVDQPTGFGAFIVASWSLVFAVVGIALAVRLYIEAVGPLLFIVLTLLSTCLLATFMWSATIGVKQVLSNK